MSKSDQERILKLLLSIQGIIYSWTPEVDNYEVLDDFERYSKMAIELEPENSSFLERNENVELNVSNTERVHLDISEIYSNHLFHSQ